MAIPPTKLTEAFIRNLTCEDKPLVVRDTMIKGLMIAVNKHSKSYKVQRGLWVGQRGRRRKAKTVRRTLGTTIELTLDDARTRAMEVIAQIKQGVDPNAPTIPGTLWSSRRRRIDFVDTYPLGYGAVGVPQDVSRFGGH